MTDTLLIDPVTCGRLCLTLLHTLWQVTLLVLVVRLIDRLWSSGSAERSYGLHVAALVVVLAAVPLTYLMTTDSSRAGDTAVPPVSEIVALAVEQNPAVSQEEVIPVSTIHLAEFPRPPVPIDPPSAATSPTGVETLSAASAVELPSLAWVDVAPWLAGGYVFGVLLMLARLASAIAKANRLSTQATIVTEGPPVGVLRSVAEAWSLNVMPALGVTERIVVPQVVGLIRPMILIPAATVAGLTAEELQMILTHELAHIRRHDMWVSLLQRLAEAFLFFNPALWWLSRRISTLREYCCDDITCRSSLTPRSPTEEESQARYAAALLRVVELSTQACSRHASLATLAASGRSPSELRRRVARLFGEPLREPVRISRGGILAIAGVVLLLTCGPALWPSSGLKNAVTAAAQEEEDSRDANQPLTFRLSVVGPDGAPVPNARVEILTMPKPGPTADEILRGTFVRLTKYRSFATTDDQGRLWLVRPGQPTLFHVMIKEPGYGPYCAAWKSAGHPAEIPDAFTAELSAAWSVGGVLVDSSGNPIEGAEIGSSVYCKTRPGDTNQYGAGTLTRSDSEGKWRYDHVPVSKRDVHVEISHPDYKPLRLKLARNGFRVEPDKTPVQRLVLDGGLTVTGIVTDESGEPIRGALLRAKFLNDIRDGRTNEQGAYRLSGCEAGATRIVVTAEGRAMDMKEVRVDPEMEPVDFAMKPGGHVRVRVVDEMGNGIPKARILFQRWRGKSTYLVFDHVNEYTDENGVWEWNEAPLDKFRADICRPGGMELSRQSLFPRDEEFVFTPPEALVVSGEVIDAKTKRPIPKFRVIPGLRNADPRIGMNWIPRDSFDATDGKYRVRLTHDYPAHLVRIEADGYQVAISRDIQTDEGKINVDFELEPALSITATVLTAAGKPAAGAEVALGVAGSQINIRNGDIDDGSTYATRTTVNAVGRFSIPAQTKAYQLVITHEGGFAHLKSEDGPIPLYVRLTPWARAEGTFRVGSNVAANVEMNVSGGGIHSYGDDVPHIVCNTETITGQDGSYVFERAFPGTAKIGRGITLTVNDGATEVTSSQPAPANFVAGKTTKLDLGGTGRLVVGKLEPATGYAGNVLWSFALINAEADLKRPPAPDVPAEVQNDPLQRQAWWGKWKATDEGKAWAQSREQYERAREAAPYITATVDRNGSFRIDDMAPGKYVLSVSFHEHSAGNLSDYQFEVPEGEDSGAIDLGTLTLE